MIYETNELYHFGVKGMKWGVRRYQNENGSLTPAGKKRYYDTPELNTLRDKRDVAREQYKSSKKNLEKASNQYSYMPTNKKWKEYEQVNKQFLADRAVYRKAKLDYTTDKEVARLREKDIDIKNKSKHRLKLEDQYKKLGMSDEQAQAAANKQIRTEKILAASAAITVTACAAYIANKKMKDRIDGVIKTGESLQRIEMRDTGGKLHDVFYASKGEHDNKRYKNLLGFARKNQTGQAYIMKLQANEDIKIASKDKAAKIFGELYKNDPEFKREVADQVSSHFNGRNRINNINNVSNKNIKKMYENFNANLVINNKSNESSVNKFYSKMKSAGYGAIQDINDMKYSGYSAKNPLIIFDNSNKNIMVKSVSELKDNSAVKATKELAKATGESVARDFIEKAGPLTAASLAAATVTTYNTDPNEYHKAV